MTRSDVCWAVAGWLAGFGAGLALGGGIAACALGATIGLVPYLVFALVTGCQR